MTARLMKGGPGDFHASGLGDEESSRPDLAGGPSVARQVAPASNLSLPSALPLITFIPMLQLYHAQRWYTQRAVLRWCKIAA